MDVSVGTPKACKLTVSNEQYPRGHCEGSQLALNSFRTSAGLHWNGANNSFISHSSFFFLMLGRLYSRRYPFWFSWDASCCSLTLTMELEGALSVVIGCKIQFVGALLLGIPAHHRLN
jgi:hypothetical protein